MQTSGVVAPRAHLRLDIQGLRTVAVVIVVLYHAGVPYLQGGYIGVDVFFVISGFLITGLLIRELESTGRISLSDFWARRARRILPAAAVALALTTILTMLFLPMTRWQWTGIEMVASAAYVVNWLFAVKSTDYLAGDDAASPVQHFWSLAVEEQFYIVWPTLLVLVVLTAVKMRKRVHPRQLVGVLATLIIVVSLVWSIVSTTNAPSEAYFATTTRLWELAVGALLAALSPLLRGLPSAAASAGAWLGLAGIVAAGVIYNADTPFPGGAAALPVVGAALVIGLGEPAGRLGPISVLSRMPMLWVGDRSYSIYLFHWPIIVAAFALLGESLWVGLAAAALSFLPAALSYAWVERPVLQKAKVWRRPVRSSLVAGAALTVVGVVLGGSIAATPRLVAPSAPDAVAMVEQGLVFGALDGVPTSSKDDLLLGPVAASGDFDTSCASTPVGGTMIRECTFGPVDADTRVLVTGDSKMRQWVGALREIADEEQWNVTAILKDSCPFIVGNVSRAGSLYDECMTWNSSVRARVEAEDFDLVITSNSLREGVDPDGRPLADAHDEVSIASIAQGLDLAWRTFTDRGIPVAVITDGPGMGFDVPDCVATPFLDLADCSTPADIALTSRGDSQRRAAEGNPMVRLIDTAPWLCADGKTCPPVIGGVVVYSDSSHITGTYAISLLPALRRSLAM